MATPRTRLSAVEEQNARDSNDSPIGTSFARFPTHGVASVSPTFIAGVPLLDLKYAF
jgi:hypothetical protein